MKKNQFLTRISLLVVCILGMFTVSSCIKEKVNLSNIGIIYQSELKAPVAYGSWSITDLLNAANSSGYIKQYPDSSLYFEDITNIYTQTANNIITLPNQAFNESFSSFPLPNGGVIKFTANTDYPCAFFNGAILDTINFSGGMLTFNITSTLTDTGSIIITLPTLTKGGIPFRETFVINHAQISGNTSNNISGYSLRDTTIGGIPNQIPVNYNINLGGSNIPNIAIGLNNLTYQSMYGYMGQYTIIDTAGNFEFNFFNNLSNTNIVLADPRFHLYFANSFGIPVSATLLNVYTLSTKTGNKVNLTFNASVNPVNVPYPKTITQTAFDTLLIDTTNCPNLSQSLAIYPQYMYYGISATTNPTGKPHNFVSDTSRLSVNLGIELPLNLKAGLYATADTLGFSPLSQFADTTDIQQVIIKCVFINGMPFDLNTQVILCDSVNGIFIHLDTIINFSKLPNVGSASINAGKVTSPYESTISINYSNHARILKLKKVNCAIINSKFSTTDNGQKFVKFYSYYRLKFYLRADVKVQIKSTL